MFYNMSVSKIFTHNENIRVVIHFIFKIYNIYRYNLDLLYFGLIYDHYCSHNEFSNNYLFQSVKVLILRSKGGNIMEKCILYILSHIMWWFIKKLVHNEHFIFQTMITPLWLVFLSILRVCAYNVTMSLRCLIEDACLMLPLCLSLIILH